ncbi:right-handed parallel beta-helix repeat-containing protein [Mucilaginibacter sp. PAMB04168]|uniref:right-handed parallel beta-helix repeat-containing protein n=1 Tax=Mucilaginibacter sp. PAMB04168 TaxID=3138567 RepID=UPI0031F6B74E
MKFLYAFCFLILWLPVAGKNYYVSSRTGNDSFNGQSPAKAKKHLQNAATLTKAGDTVFVMNGVYSNDCDVCDVLSITKGGKRNKYVVFTNFPGHHPVIKFDGWAGISVKKGASYVRINGFEVVGDNANVKLAKALAQPQGCVNKKGTLDPLYNGNGIIVQPEKNKRSHHIIISNNTVHDCGGGGIGAIQADYIIVEGNTVYNTSWYTVFGTSGIAFYQFWNSDRAGGYHNIIRRNKCYNNKSLVPWMKNCQISDGNGIIIDDFRNKQNGSRLGNYQGRTLIENNISWFNGGTGIHTFQSDHIDIINNTAYCNSRTKGLNAGQILSGLSNDNKIINNILVSDSTVMINSNYVNTNLTYQNNIHYNITYPKYEKLGITGPACINGVNPGFVNPANSLKASFKLLSNSIAIDKGHTIIFSKTDFDGRIRDQATAPDIGAYEY